MLCVKYTFLNEKYVFNTRKNLIFILNENKKIILKLKTDILNILDKIKKFLLKRKIKEIIFLKMTTTPIQKIIGKVLLL